VHQKLVLQFVLIVDDHIDTMDTAPKAVPETQKPAMVLYCPVCAVEVNDPLTCGDCSSVICRRCGTPLESPDELAMG
jgi:predicted phosphoribosyltransferase